MSYDEKKSPTGKDVGEVDQVENVSTSAHTDGASVNGNPTLEEIAAMDRVRDLFSPAKIYMLLIPTTLHIFIASRQPVSG